MKMNILYCIDEGKKDYSRYLGVSILSLLENNKEENIHIYIVSQYIEESNKQELIRIVESYGDKITFSEGEIIPDKFKKALHLQGGRPIATYYRFFFSNCFNIKNRLLYLDCDTIVNKNLAKIYNSDFEGNTFIGTIDDKLTLYHREKKLGTKQYINAGVILIDIEKFSNIDLYAEVIKFNDKFGFPEYCDQDYINVIFNGKIKIINELQCICARPRERYNLSNYYILHTVRKPNEGGFGLCKKEIESIFNEYLKRTKRENYIGYKKVGNIKTYLGFIYEYTTRLLVFLSLKLFGTRFGYKVNYFFSLIGKNIGILTRKYLIKE